VESERSDPAVQPAAAAADGGTVAAHLARMHAQRGALFDALAGVSEGRLWERPAPKKWSPGEHLDHTRVLNRSFRRLLTLAWGRRSACRPDLGSTSSCRRRMAVDTVPYDEGPALSHALASTSSSTSLGT
jgi:hypothetical protein